MRARNFQAPVLPAKPKLLRRVDNVGAIARERLVTLFGGGIVVKTVGTRRDQISRNIVYMDQTRSKAEEAIYLSLSLPCILTSDCRRRRRLSGSG